MTTMSEISRAIKNWELELDGEDYYGLFESIWIRWRDEDIFSPDLAKEWQLYITKENN